MRIEDLDQLVLRMSPKRLETLRLLEKGALLMWNDGGWGEPIRWWVDGNPGRKLHDATCHWLVRSGMVIYDVEFNDAPDRPIHDGRNRLGVFAYRITERGHANLRHRAPKAKILKFARSAKIGKSGYRGFPSKRAYEDHYSDVRNYAEELPSMKAYAEEADLDREASLALTSKEPRSDSGG